MGGGAGGGDLACSHLRKYTLFKFDVIGKCVKAQCASSLMSITLCVLIVLCILIVMYILFCIFCFHRANWHSPATLTEVFPCFFLSCKANARVYIPRKDGTRSALFLISELNYSMYCLCVNVYYCYRVSNQLQLNISHHYHISINISYPLSVLLNDSRRKAHHTRSKT
jgi:hypothetical protein